MSDWIEQVGISRSAAYELLRLTGIEPEPRKIPGTRKPVSHLLPDQLEILDPLARQLRDGATMPQIREQLSQGVQPVAIQRSGQAPTPALADLISLMAASQQASVDPLASLRRLKEAVELGLPLSTDELAQITGFARGTVRHWPDGYSPRPGFTIKKQKHGNAVFWSVIASSAQQ